MGYDKSLEKEIIKLGFKKETFQDNSGHWFNKKIKYKDLKLNIYIETDNKMLVLQAKTGVYMDNKITMNKYYDDVKQYKLTLPNVKALIKKYK